ncbi:MAG: hypothetical protein MRT15_07995 [archaeon YNP-LCB-003-016]|uniref:hypothetical protein n=1 Tax=Candidatus Culexarchaeum yellowstonense TaxID=2928963 RepID=UPI0026F21F95|nr:hypothetical protein [Candidatus Culexarchaeum yellowstonense]MCR6692318.1 hypothetical protein [Candidatus Culexarchaeum yellowstonense]
MVKIKISYPVDGTFLSSLLFEGLLYTMSKSDCKINVNSVEFGDAKFISQIYAELDDQRIKNIKVPMVGNDNINKKLFEKFGFTGLASKKTYSDLLNTLKSICEKITITRELNISAKLKKDYILVDLDDKSEGIQAAIFKAERYIGISSAEAKLISKHLTQYFSKEVTLILLLGLYSSFIATVAWQRQQRSSFFLTFSTEDIMKLLRGANREQIEIYFEIKDEAMNALRNIILKNPHNELLFTEMALNVQLQKLLREKNIDKISFTLFKVTLEGQIYKIYEQIPLTILSESPFSKVASKFFNKKSGDLINYLHWLFSSPNSIILNSLADPNNPVYSNMISAVNAMYRFVMLGDIQGWFEFIRELYNAHEKTKNEKGESEYIKIVKNIGVYV